MKKFFIFLFAGAFAFAALTSCSDDEDEIKGSDEVTYDDAYYAAQATVTSSDSNYTATDEGGEIHFKTEGGSVTVSVDCGTEWTVDNTAPDYFTTSLSATTLVIEAEQNVITEELTGTITVKTAAQGISFATITVTQSAYGAPEITVDIDEISFPACGEEMSAEVVVEASDDWTAAAGDDCDWLTIEQTETGVTITASENVDTAERTTKITFTCTDGVTSEYEYVDVYQDGAAYITLGSEAVSFSIAPGSAYVEVESNFDWEYSYEGTWFSVSSDEGGITVTVEGNDDDSREGTITITAGDGAVNVAEAELTVYQPSARSMILTYKITSAGTETRVPLYKDSSHSLNCTINWGDGSEPESVTDYEPTHIYAAAGEYDITIDGIVTYLNNYSVLSASDIIAGKDSKIQELIGVKQWGETGLTSMSHAFYNCPNLATLPEYTGDSFKEVTTFTYAFYDCPSLQAIPNGIFDRCTEVTSFSYCFSGCNVVKEIPVGLFNSCSKVTTFASVFQNCYIVPEIPEGLFDNCPLATDFGFAFYGCSAVKAIPDGLFDSCEDVTTFYGVFYNCSTIESVPEGLFDLHTKCENVSQIFYGCSSLKSIPAKLFASQKNVATTIDHIFYKCSSLDVEEEVLSGLIDFTKGKNGQYMFAECSSLKSVPADVFNLPEATSMQYVFYGCESLTEIPEGIFSTCTEVTDYARAFQGCSGLTEVPADLFSYSPYVTTFQYTFYNCTGLVTIPTSIFDKNLEVTNFGYTFWNCTSVEGESPFTNYTTLDMGEMTPLGTVQVHLYERSMYTTKDSTGLYFEEPKTYGGCFRNATFSDMVSVPEEWQ